MKENLSMSDSRLIQRRRFLILYLGIALEFFASMSKMLVPGPIYDDLQGELLFTPSQIASLGAGYMYAYAASQLLVGILSDRYGGVRVLLGGGALFALGLFCFPLLDSYPVMMIVRGACGWGAGVVFIGMAKLLHELLPEKFGVMLGALLFVSYSGSVVGTVPMVWLIGAIGWRGALLLVGAVSCILMICIGACARGTMQKVLAAQSLKPLFRMLGNPRMYYISLSTGILFGVYYALLTQMGQKCIEDTYHWDTYWASATITLLAVIVALINLFWSVILKIFHGHRMNLIILVMWMALLGTILGVFTFHFAWSGGVLLISWVLIAIAAGFFPLYASQAKAVNPPEDTGLSVSMINFSAFVFIALFGNVAGWILNFWHQSGGEELHFPPQAYETLFGVFAVFMILALLLLLLPDRLRRNKASRILQLRRQLINVSEKS